MMPIESSERASRAAAVFLLALCLSVAAGAEPVMRCAWADPGSGQPLHIDFSGDAVVVVRPNETIKVGCGEGKVELLKEGVPIRDGAELSFAAPENPGDYYLPLRLSSGGQSRDTVLCVFVADRATLTRTEKGHNLTVFGKNMGEYRLPKFSGNRKVRDNPDSYEPPELWFRSTPANENSEVVPGLKVGDLVVPNEETGIKHTDIIPVNYPMWRATATVRQALAEKGIPPEAMKTISCFRAPLYNRGIGSNAFGRHIYGDAFDFYIDLKNDGKAGDLNRDGKLDQRDAYPVVAIIEDLQAEGKIPMGGVGVYHTVGGDHIVTMHVDLRGHRATWGTRTGAGGKKSEFSWQSRRFADLDAQDEAIAREQAAKDGKKYWAPNREPLPNP